MAKAENTMQETRHQHEDNHLTTPLDTASAPGGTAIHLSLSHLMAGAVAVGLSAVLSHQHVQPFPALLVALAAAAICGFLCTLNLQYSLYLLEMTLSRLAHGLPVPEANTLDEKKCSARRWPVRSLFLRLQELEQRIGHYAANEQLTTDLREKAVQQAGSAAAQAERNRIARELHDSIKQQIFSISVSAAAAKAHWQGEGTEDAREAVEDIQRSAKEAQVEMQALLQQLRPAPLENVSLIDALNVQAQALGFRTGAQVHVDIGEMPDNDRLLPGTQDAIFRQVQEAFANIARHARASTIWLEVRTCEHELQIEVRDDGQGFDMAQAHKGMGLSNLDARAQELHGSVEISSQPGQGTTVAITLPLLEALKNAEEEERRAYVLMRESELARRGFQLCENFAPLSMVLIAIAGLGLFPMSWIIVALCSLVAVYGYVSGFSYRTQVTLNAGAQSLTALALKQQNYGANRNLILMLGFCIWYGFFTLKLLDSRVGLWSIFGLSAGIVALNQVVRRRYYRDTDDYYRLISSEALRWELERRRQRLNISLKLFLVAAAAVLISAHALFVFPPVNATEWFHDGVALILLTAGAGLFFHYRQLQRWRETLRKRELNASAKEAARD